MYKNNNNLINQPSNETYTFKDVINARFNGVSKIMT